MSADNYNLIRHGLDGRYRVWLNLSDSGDQEEQVRGTKPNAEFDDYEAALEWTEKNTGYTEYGTVLDEEREPGKCICEARMEGECCCGAWDEPLPRRADDPEKVALLARVRELETEVAQLKVDLNEARGAAVDSVFIAFSRNGGEP